jgi:sulfite reductase (NADPH) flavoprotein alpha-component
MKIYFASMTGNAESLAYELEQKMTARGLDVQVLDLAELSAINLFYDEYAVFVVSTWGEGEPPDSADEFWAKLQAADFDLKQLRYAVFGLGDRSYDIFNGFARDLDERLQHMEAVPVIRRVEADCDYEDDYAAWEIMVLSTFMVLIADHPEQTAYPHK